MHLLKNIALVLGLVLGVYWLSQQYKAADSLNNIITEHIQEAHVTYLTYLEQPRAAQGNYQVSAIDSALMDIDVYLQAGQRLEVLARGEALLMKDPGNVEALLRVGIVYLQEYDYTLAQEQLTVVQTTSNTPTLQVEAAWYLALLQAKTANWERSQFYLQKVLSTHSPYRRTAEDLIGLINQKVEA